MDEASNGMAAIDRPPPPLLLSAKLFSIDGRMIVTVLALGDDAAVATTLAPPPEGSIAVLTRGGIRLPATVSWRDGQRFGMRLDEPAGDDLVQQFSGTARLLDRMAARRHVAASRSAREGLDAGRCAAG